MSSRLHPVPHRLSNHPPRMLLKLKSGRKSLYSNRHTSITMLQSIHLMKMHKEETHPRTSDVVLFRQEFIGIYYGASFPMPRRCDDTGLGVSVMRFSILWPVLSEATTTTNVVTVGGFGYAKETLGDEGGWGYSYY